MSSVKFVSSEKVSYTPMALNKAPGSIYSLEVSMAGKRLFLLTEGSTVQVRYETAKGKINFAQAIIKSINFDKTIFLKNNKDECPFSLSITWKKGGTSDVVSALTINNKIK